MKWINYTKEDEYFDYEILSECKIIGALEYSNGKVLCRMNCYERSKLGLYSYTLRVASIDWETFNSVETLNKAEKKEAYSKSREDLMNPGYQLVYLFSLFFRCRFYMNTITSGKISPNEIRLKVKEPFVRSHHIPPRHKKSLCSENKNFAIGLSDFLDKCRDLTQKKEKVWKKFIISCYQYWLALNAIGIDHHLVFMRLVSAIETLSKDMKLSKEEDVLKEIKDDLIEKVSELELSNEQMFEFKNLFEHRKIKAKFIKFITNHSSEFPFSKDSESNKAKIPEKNLEETLDAIYKKRSKFLHEGQPIGYTESNVPENYEWDKAPYHAVPYTYWFEGLVRHCLLNYLDEELKKN